MTNPILYSNHRTKVVTIDNKDTIEATALFIGIHSMVSIYSIS